MDVWGRASVIRGGGGVLWVAAKGKWSPSSSSSGRRRARGNRRRRFRQMWTGRPKLSFRAAVNRVYKREHSVRAVQRTDNSNEIRQPFA